MDDTALEFARYEPTTGHRPEAENEIIADTKTLEALGVPAEIGATVTLNYEIKGKEYTTDFELCGFWETDSLSRSVDQQRKTSICILSRRKKGCKAVAHTIYD